MGRATCPECCQGTVRTSHAQPVSLAQPQAQPQPQDRGGCCNPTSQTIPASAAGLALGKGQFRSVLLLLSILTEVKDTEHPHQVPTSGRQQGTELPCCIHPHAEHHLPFMISLQKGKKKKLAGSPGMALPPSCSRFMWLQRLSHFQRHTNPVNGCLTAHCVCSDTAPLPRKNNSERVWMCVYTKALKRTLLAFLQLC